MCRSIVGLQIRMGAALETDIFTYIPAHADQSMLKPWCECAKSVLDHMNTLHRQQGPGRAMVYALVDHDMAREYVTDFFSFCANETCLYMPEKPVHIAGTTHQPGSATSPSHYDATFADWFFFGEVLVCTDLLADIALSIMHTLI